MGETQPLLHVGKSDGETQPLIHFVEGSLVAVGPRISMG